MTLRRTALLIGGLLVLLVVALAVLALPFRGVQADAEAARSDLVAAKQALGDGKIDQATALVESARAHVDDAQRGVDGVGGDVWSVVPVAGGGVSDVRHLVAALDDATAIAEIGVDTYPTVAGKHATLFRNERIDLPTLASVVVDVTEAGRHLESAYDSLEDVEGRAPFIGDKVAAARDAALDEVAPLHESYQYLDPLLGNLPAVLGAERDQRYLVTMLNPAELRYSGGANLEISTLTLSNGKAELTEGDIHDYSKASVPIEWKKVRGNDFHRPGPLQFRSATFAPSWSVSGEELLRAWKVVSGKRADGVIAIDVVALAHLFGVTGPLDVPGYGELNADNLVETLVGSYDKFPDPAQQDALNAAIVPAFRERLFEGGQFAEKAQVLDYAADGRHFAVYFRDAEVQESFDGLGLTGDLSADPEDGPLGVATQNTNGSKTDYWQRRSITQDVTLDSDGTARVELGVEIHNQTPPYVQPVPDPRVGYFTRWSGMALAVFLPPGADVTDASLQGRSFTPYVGDFLGRPWFYRKLMLPPGGTGRLATTYDVPGAVDVGSDGELTYRLTFEPQGLVNPESLDLTVHLPEGYAATSVPEGWTVGDDGTVRFSTDALTTSPTWEILAEPTD